VHIALREFHKLEFEDLTMREPNRWRWLGAEFMIVVLGVLSAKELKAKIEDSI
jgi:hypothetical protein